MPAGANIVHDTVVVAALIQFDLRPHEQIDVYRLFRQMNCRNRFESHADRQNVGIEIAQQPVGTVGGYRRVVDMVPRQQSLSLWAKSSHGVGRMDAAGG